MMPECQFFPTLAGNRWNGYRFQNNRRPSRCPLREIRKTAVKWPQTEAASLAAPINLESEFGLENGAGFVPDLDCQRHLWPRRPGIAQLLPAPLRYPAIPCLPR